MINYDALGSMTKEEICLYMEDLRSLCQLYRERSEKQSEVIYLLQDIAGVTTTVVETSCNIDNAERYFDDKYDLFGRKKRRAEIDAREEAIALAKEQAEIDREKKIAKAKRLKKKGKTFEEIAKEVELDESAVRSLLH